MQKVIETFNLTKKYGKQQVLDNVNIEVKQGDIYGFVGRNGAGKSTLMRILMGLSFATSGSYQLLGQKNVLEARRLMSSVIESPAFYLNMTAEQNLVNHCLMLGISKKNIDRSLEQVGLINDKKKRVKNYSLGMKQRLALAKALINQSKVIILDEPTNGLDPEGIEDLRNIILRLNQEKGVTFLISSHYLAELQNVATRYGFIEKGKICEVITSEALKKKLQEKILIEVTNVEKAQNLLKEKFQINFELDYLDSKYADTGILIIENGTDIGEINALFQNNSIHINTIQKRQLTLEDYFFKVTSGKKGEINNEKFIKHRILQNNSL